MRPGHHRGTGVQGSHETRTPQGYRRDTGTPQGYRKDTGTPQGHGYQRDTGAQDTKGTEGYHRVAGVLGATIGTQGYHRDTARTQGYRRVTEYRATIGTGIPQGYRKDTGYHRDTGTTETP
ncbi:hypothetical protein NDU88_006999 [Pleurodeles waltl]|uniref:Uncharacterized protein n=1 Tax=Pleurodeles waltl TaxID=8319 RepID=A0AAV7WC71_PLEWA|nr:hypothetical protein NDU88_006997 [Pleurodeles waltl]KAJ1211641.1 hypothetical protein NDU88_006999 [Pleurodeles waltl]